MMEYVITSRGPVICTQHIGKTEIARMGIPVSARGLLMIGPESNGDVVIFASEPFKEANASHSDDIRSMIKACDVGIPLKYINDRHRGFMVFQTSHNHDDFRLVCQNIDSAGFVTLAIRDSRIYAHCHGESISLGIGHKSGDAEFLSSRFNSDM